MLLWEKKCLDCSHGTNTSSLLHNPHTDSALKRSFITNPYVCFTEMVEQGFPGRSRIGWVKSIIFEGVIGGVLVCALIISDMQWGGERPRPYGWKLDSSLWHQYYGHEQMAKSSLAQFPCCSVFAGPQQKQHMPPSAGMCWGQGTLSLAVAEGCIWLEKLEPRSSPRRLLLEFVSVSEARSILLSQSQNPWSWVELGASHSFQKVWMLP